MRGRNNNNNSNNNNNNNNRKNQNPMTRVYESNGPDIKIRGTPSHIAEKYIQLARDSQSSGDPISAENYYQHAEHYLRLIAAAQEQFRQNQPQFYRPDNDTRDDTFDDGDDESGMGQQQPQFSQGDNGPYEARDQQSRDQQPRDQQAREQQPYIPRENHIPRENQSYPRHDQQPRPQPAQASGEAPNTGLPSFITGGQPQPPIQYGGGNGQNGPNGHEGGQGDRFPLHRRRRRHRGPRPDLPGGIQGPSNDSSSGPGPDSD
jgi:hypothetical protein